MPLFYFYFSLRHNVNVRFWAIEEGYIERSKMSSRGFDGF